MTTKSIQYREIMIQMKRVRNICQRVKNSTRESKVDTRYHKHSERRILTSAMEFLGDELTDMLAGGDVKLGFVFLSMIIHFGIIVEAWDFDYKNPVWMNLLQKGDILAAEGVINLNYYQEYVNTIWEMFELSPRLFANRLALFKLGLT